MRYIKTYEKFDVNETLDMFTMPVDPIKGAADVYADVYADVKQWLGDKAKEWLSKADNIFDELAKKYSQILPRIETYFGTTADKLTYEYVLNKLQKSNEGFVDRLDNTNAYGGQDFSFSDSKGFIQKVGHIIQSICGINILTFGLMGTWLIEFFTNLQVGPALSMVYSCVAIIIVHIVRKLVQMGTDYLNEK